MWSGLVEFNAGLCLLRLGRQGLASYSAFRAIWRREVRSAGLGLVSAVLVLVLGITSPQPHSSGAAVAMTGLVSGSENTVTAVSHRSVASQNGIEEDIQTEQRLQHSRLVSPTLTRHLLTGAHLFTSEPVDSTLSSPIGQQVSSTAFPQDSAIQ